MATKKITELTELTAVADDDFLPIVDTSGATTKKITRLNFIAGLTPPASIIAYGGNVAPSGWLICDGTAVSRTTYATLFSAIGTTYGVGDNSTTFNLPNLLGRAIVGFDGSQTEFNTVGKTGGAKTHTLTTGEIPAHNHGVTDPSHNHGVNDPSHSHGLSQIKKRAFGSNASGSFNPFFDDLIYPPSGRNTDNATTGISLSGAFTGISIQNAGGGGAHNNLQPYMAINYIIKT